MSNQFKRSNLEQQVPNLPQTVTFCKKCLISNQRPRIIFNNEGVCSACVHREERNHSIDWAIRENNFEDLLAAHRRNDGQWDVLVPSSGGKDSGYVAHRLKYKHHMNPLTVTWAPMLYTEKGLENFNGLCDAGFLNIKCTPNGLIHRKLARLSFEEFGDAFHVFVLGQMYFPMHMALKFNIPLVMYGENGEVEYAGDPNAVDKPYKDLVHDEKWIKGYLKGVSFQELLDYGLEHKDYIHEEDMSLPDLQFYQPPPREQMLEKGISKIHYYGHYFKWNPQENFYYCAEHTNFTPNDERSEGTYSKYASLDDKMDGFHYYMRYIKFGLGRCIEDVAHEIRDGHINKEEGIALLKRYEGEFPLKYFKTFLAYLGITEEHFWQVVDSWRLPHLWKKDGSTWHLRHPVKSGSDEMTQVVHDRVE